jgi:hypothetical protein
MIVMMGRTTDGSVALNHPKSGPARTASQVHPSVRSQPCRQPQPPAALAVTPPGCCERTARRKLPRAGRT